MKIYTAQYNYKGKDRLDITAKTEHFLAPSWNMVRAYKNGKISKHTYTRLYYSRLTRLVDEKKEEVDNFLELKKVTLVCYCKSGDFCHRVLAANLFGKVGGIKYKGERK